MFLIRTVPTVKSLSQRLSHTAYATNKNYVSSGDVRKVQAMMKTYILVPNANIVQFRLKVIKIMMFVLQYLYHIVLIMRNTQGVSSENLITIYAY
jgi:lipoprotein NlpI